MALDLNLIIIGSEHMEKYEENIKWNKGAIAKLNSDPNFHFIIREAEIEKALNKSKPITVEMVLKKGALYGTKAIILLKEPEVIRCRGQCSGSDFYLPFEYKYSSPSQSLQSLYNLFNKDSSFQKIFYFSPEQVMEEDYDYDEVEHLLGGVINRTVVSSFSALYNNKFGVFVSFTDPTVNAHIFETLQCKNNELSVLNTWLPQLENIPFDILLKLREDEEDSFKRFQFALKHLIVDSAEANSETKLKELFQFVDYEVRSFETKMNQIKKSRVLKAYEAVVSLSIMGLCFAIPSEIAKLITAFLGFSQGKEFINFLFRDRQQMYQLKASDFYVPWLCTKKKR